MNLDNKVILFSRSTNHTVPDDSTDRDKEKLAFVIENNRLVEIAVEGTPSYREGIYLGKVQNVRPNLQACFVEITKGILCFLRFTELEQVKPILINRRYDGKLLVGDEILVQVVADPIKSKQMSVTTKLSVKGRYLVLSMGKPLMGISAKIPKKYREYIKIGMEEQGIIDAASKTKQLKGMGEDELPTIGCIVRTQTLRSYQIAEADTEHNKFLITSLFDEIAKEYETLCQEMNQLLERAKYRNCFTCLLPPPSYFEAILQRLDSAKKWEIVTDLPTSCGIITKYLHTNCLEEKMTVRLYHDDILPLSKLYSAETHLKEVLTKRVWLKSGAYVVIEPTEALTVIDVNTGKALKKSASAPTFFYQINLEAAKEIARQIRLRNLSGIILVDFINMDGASLEQNLLHELRILFMQDPTKTEVIDITPLGLVEITRKRIGRPISEQLSTML